MIVGGRLGDVFGRRRIFVIGIAGFTLASVACALAPSPDVLIATRVLQGGFGALLIPQGLGMIKTVFPPEGDGRRVRGVRPGHGPRRDRRADPRRLAGHRRPARHRLAHDLPHQRAARRRWACSARCGSCPESRSPERLRLDPLGVVLISAASLCLIYPLVQGRELRLAAVDVRASWRPASRCSAVFAAGASAARARHAADRAVAAAQPRVHVRPGRAGSCSSPASPGCCWWSRCSCSSGCTSRRCTPA